MSVTFVHIVALNVDAKGELPRWRGFINVCEDDAQLTLPCSGKCTIVSATCRCKRTAPGILHSWHDLLGYVQITRDQRQTPCDDVSLAWPAP